MHLNTATACVAAAAILFTVEVQCTDSRKDETKMISVRQGGCVYGPGVFMFENEAASVKTELTARGTKEARRLAGEIGMPSDGRAYAAGRAETDRETVEDVLETMRLCNVPHDWPYIRELADRLTNALERERALRLAK